MMIDIPDKYFPILLPNGTDMGRLFSRAVVGSIDCVMLVRSIIKKHPDDLEEYLADFLYGIKLAEMSND